MIEEELIALLTPLYGVSKTKELVGDLCHLADAAMPPATRTSQVEQPFQASDVLLVTYGDSLTHEQNAPLAELKRFADANLTRCFSAIHILPFFPYSSDDGFAVSDYGKVRPDLGDWGEVYQLTEHFELMFDLVINHCSREHRWFAQFIAGNGAGADYFITADPKLDYGSVVRPRSTPLLTPVHTANGQQHVWTTFGEDQVDLDFANPQVLLTFVEILLDYVRRGARYVRLDAIGFLWKTPGTNCMSLPQTHAVVKAMRLLLSQVAPDVRLLTETNVPHAENVSYFGAADEAHLVYQFSLAPLLLYSYLFGDARQFSNWLQSLDTPPPGSTYLNFMASHDGVGLRPLEGLVSSEDIQALVDLTHERGGFVSMRTGSDGTPAPYELNITLFSLFGGRIDDIPAYVGAHQLLLALQGVPAIYIHSLFGSLNDLAAVERTGRTRSINRGRWRRNELLEALASSEHHYRTLFGVLKHSLSVRRATAAFSPSARQQVLDSSATFLILRRWTDADQVIVVASFQNDAQQVAWPSALVAGDAEHWLDLLAGTKFTANTPILLQSYQVCWLTSN